MASGTGKAQTRRRTEGLAPWSVSRQPPGSTGRNDVADPDLDFVFFERVTPLPAALVRVSRELIDIAQIPGVVGPVRLRLPWKCGCELRKPAGEYRIGEGAVALFAPTFAAALGEAFAELNRRKIIPTITSGFRTEADQQRMRSGGSGNNPAAKQSLHEIGQAVDLNTRAGDFTEIVSVMKRHGFVWGGEFTNVDRPHFQLLPKGTKPDKKQLAACREARRGTAGYP